MNQSDQHSLIELLSGKKIYELKKIAKGMEYNVYISDNHKYVIKKPRLHIRLIGLSDCQTVNNNFKKCTRYLEENELPLSIPLTWIEEYNGICYIIQEYVPGYTDIKLAKKAIENINSLPNEDNYIDLRVDNIISYAGKLYFLDISGGFYYQIAVRFSKKTSILVWHFLQISKLLFKKSQHIFYQDCKIYINLKYASFLKNITQKNKYGKRLRILVWHLAGIYHTLFKYRN